MVCRISFRNYSKLSGSIDPGYTYTAEKSTKDNTRLCSIAVIHIFTIKPFLMSLLKLYQLSDCATSMRNARSSTRLFTFLQSQQARFSHMKFRINTKKFPVFKNVAMNSFLLGLTREHILPKRQLCRHSASVTLITLHNNCFCPSVHAPKQAFLRNQLRYSDDIDSVSLHLQIKFHQQLLR